MAVLSGYSPDMEIYSIDEAFLGLDGFEGWDLDAYARDLRATVKRWTGIVVSVGIAPTKTLAKIAAERAKKDPVLAGVAILTDRVAIEAALAATPVGDVWGVGRQWAKRFPAFGVYTALDFSRQSEFWVRKKMGVTGARTQVELLGTSCLDLESQPHSHKSCVSSRSFARPVTAYDDVKDAVATFAARAGERVRQGGLVAGQVMVFAHTDRFNTQQPQVQATATVALPSPSNLTADLTRGALQALRQAYRPGLRYKKAGVMLLDLAPLATHQATLFAPSASNQVKAERLQQALDSLNGGQRGGRDLVRFGLRPQDIAPDAARGGAKGSGWSLRRDHKSPRYTTSWAELRVVKA
jgi:DNA polymerase V